MEQEGSLPCSQNPGTDLYPERIGFGPHLHTPCPRFNIVVLYTPWIHEAVVQFSCTLSLLSHPRQAVSRFSNYLTVPSPSATVRCTPLSAGKRRRDVSVANACYAVLAPTLWSCSVHISTLAE